MMEKKMLCFRWIIHKPGLVTDCPFNLTYMYI